MNRLSGASAAPCPSVCSLSPLCFCAPWLCVTEGRPMPHPSLCPSSAFAGFALHRGVMGEDWRVRVSMCVCVSDKAVLWIWCPPGRLCMLLGCDLQPCECVCPSLCCASCADAFGCVCSCCVDGVPAALLAPRAPAAGASHPPQRLSSPPPLPFPTRPVLVVGGSIWRRSFWQAACRQARALSRGSLAPSEHFGRQHRRGVCLRVR